MESRAGPHLHCIACGSIDRSSCSVTHRQSIPSCDRHAKGRRTMTAAKAALIGPHNMGRNPTMDEEGFQKPTLRDWMDGAFNGSGRPTLGAPPCSSFPPPEKHPGMCVPPRAPGMASLPARLHGSTASTQRMRQRLLTVAKFSCPGLPVALTRADGHDRANMDGISLFPC